jgi:hypothetical protein
MKNKWRDRIGDLALILLFLAILAASGYAIVKIMTRWTIKGLGY